MRDRFFMWAFHVVGPQRIIAKLAIPKLLQSYWVIAKLLQSLYINIYIYIYIKYKKFIVKMSCTLYQMSNKKKHKITFLGFLN